jgi:hypothetical protein
MKNPMKKESKADPRNKRRVSKTGKMLQREAS